MECLGSPTNAKVRKRRARPSGSRRSRDHQAHHHLQCVLDPKVMAAMAMQRLYSCLTRSLSEAASSVAASMIAAIAINPAVNEPVKSLNQPIMLGPTKPPNTPMVLMKANPPAAPTPVKNRVGTFQKMARAEVTPISAMVKPASATSSELVSSTDATKPTAPRKQATERLATFLPVRSICQAHRIIAAEAKR